MGDSSLETQVELTDRVMMEMTFHTSCDHEKVLFSWFEVTKGENLAVSCLIIFLIGVFYHVIRQAQIKLRAFYQARILQQLHPVDESDEVPLYPGWARLNDKWLKCDEATGLVYMKYPCSGGYGYVLEATLQFVYYFYAYSMMLIFMTYQVHMCLALCLGLAAGFYLVSGLAGPIGRLRDNSVEPVSQTEQEFHCCD